MTSEDSLYVPDRRAYLDAASVEALVAPLLAEIAVVTEQLAAVEADIVVAERATADGQTLVSPATDQARAEAESMRAAALTESARALEEARSRAARRRSEAKAEASAILQRASLAEPSARSMATSTSEAVQRADATTPLTPTSQWAMLLEPVVVEGPSGETWRLRGEAPASQRSAGRWARTEFLLPMLAAVSILIVMLALVG